MNTILHAAKSPRRPFLLLGLGLLAGLVETALSGNLPDGMEGVAIRRAAFALVIGLGLAIDAGIPVPRLRTAAIWCAVGGFGDALFSPVSAALGRFTLGAGLGLAVAAPGPLHPVPWAAALRGAVGACLAALAAHVLASRGAPIWILPAVESLIIGLSVAQGRAQRLLHTLSGEIESIRVRSDQEAGKRADRIVTIAVQTIEELDACEEQSGEDPSETRAETAMLARRALGLLRRLSAVHIPDNDLTVSIESALRRDEERLERLYRSALGRVLEEVK
jgi:hypothetical protein